MIQKYMRYGILTLFLLTLPATFSLADSTDLLSLEDEQIVEVAAGYRFVDTDNSPNRAAEYSYLNDSPTFNFVVKRYDTGRKFSLVGDYLGHKDFNFAGDLDTNLFRLHLRSERMYHNLDHVPYLPDPAGRENYDPDPLPASDVGYTDNDPGNNYGRRITINEIKLRGKIPDYPAHINLSYWRLEKKGDMQLRFVDENCAGSCHMQSGTRKNNMVTEEITAGFDAHLGPADIAFLQTWREFREKSADPSDPFNSHSLGRPASDPNNPGTFFEHDTAPDSRLIESTFKVNLPPSGGFVTSASYTIGKRENESDGNDIRPVDTETDYQKLAADVTYTPGEKWTVNFRYRMLDLDSDGPATQSSSYNFGPAFATQAAVRQSIDIDRNNYAANISYRPSRRLTLKGDYEREDIDRNHTGPPTQFSSFGGVEDPYWDVPSNETIDRFRLSFFSRHLERSALKLNGWYEYKHVDNPAYGSSLSSSNEFFFNVSYKPSAVWGATGSLDILRGKNDDRTLTQFDKPDAGTPTPISFDLDRNEERENLALGLWFIPNSIVSADFNYGMLHSKIDQDTLYGSGPDPDLPPDADYSFVDDDGDFEQRVHTLSAGINLRILENLNCRVEGYHIRSKSEFTPGSENFIGPNITDPRELKDISEVDIRQNGIKSRITWQFTRMLRAQFEYTYDDYDDQNSDVFDGSAQTFIASLGGSF